MANAFYEWKLINGSKQRYTIARPPERWANHICWPLRRPAKFGDRRLADTTVDGASSSNIGHSRPKKASADGLLS